MRSAYLYRVLAEIEAGTPREQLFFGLARAAIDQSEIWRQRLPASRQSSPANFQPDVRTRIVGNLVRWAGPRRARAVLAAMKVRGLSIYSNAPPGHVMPTAVEQVGKRHRGAGAAGNLRAAVFGVNDGLVSNCSLMLGVAGASSNNTFIILSGAAGLVAGAFSMAAGEYVSVRSQREMFEHQIALERTELAEYPEEEAAELALIYAARGMPEDAARELARATVADPARALDVLAREELGLDPHELGSPWGAATASFAAFALGAMVPLAAFMFTQGSKALALSVATSAVALFAVGAVLSLFTGRSALASGARMLLIGAAAGALSHAIGRLLGVTVA